MTVNWAVRPSPQEKSIGIFEGPEFQAKCALGREGMATQLDMCEGDFKTPLGIYPVRRLLYRSDKIAAPDSTLSIKAITDKCGWCDDPERTEYNRYVELPFSGSFETLMRDDDIYDLILVIGHNDNPVVAGKGSAVFIHVARPGYLPTAGCVALAFDDLIKLVGQLSPTDQIEILGP
jgi:L,D-peptidoglycan transpeptidase YkuD (ErfK/YbiS/YcfS/YnhG family)